MIEFEINGQKIVAEEGATIIEAADDAGIYIPRFCYHKHLTIAANCRMCLVEVEKSGKPLPACATPATTGMKVFTQSDKAVDAQRGVMEYLLINHPLDCPICDQGGECELQDLSMGFGRSCSHYEEGKRSVYNENLGPLIATEMTRCIQCTRCVRFGEEVAGKRELGVVNRGEKEQITTYVEHMMESELSGNIIDLCPVGALLAKPSRFEVRGWELQEHPVISPHDCVGSNLFVHSRFQEFAPQRLILRAVPRENKAINETWLSDRDRFSYQGLYHFDRVYKPRIKRGHQWEEVDWSTALTTTIERLRKVKEEKGADRIAALATPNSTVEEFYLLQKYLRALGSNNLDHRIRQLDFSEQNAWPLYPHLAMNIADIENLSTVLLIGSDVRTEQPLICHRFNKAFQEGAKIFTINPVHYQFPFVAAEKIVTHDILLSLKQIAKAVAEELNLSIDTFSEIPTSAQAKSIAHEFKNANKAGLFLGSHALHHPQATQILSLVSWIAKQFNLQVSMLSDGANSAGAYLAGMLPHRGVAGKALDHSGADAKSLLTSDSADAYILLNIEPEFDCAFSGAALQTLRKAKLVVCVTTYVTPAMEEYADVILPAAPFTENEGTFVNAEGSWQSFVPASVPMGESKPAWQIIRILAQWMSISGFEYKNIQHVLDEITCEIDQISDFNAEMPLSFENERFDETQILRIADWPMYRVDNLVRRATALQATLPKDIASIRLNTTTARRNNFAAGDLITAKQEGGQVTLPLVIDDRLADHSAVIPFGLEQTAGFGSAMAAVELVKELE